MAVDRVLGRIAERVGADGVRDETDGAVTEGEVAAARVQAAEGQAVAVAGKVVRLGTAAAVRGAPRVVALVGVRGPWVDSVTWTAFDGGRREAVPNERRPSDIVNRVALADHDGVAAAV